jgi:AcrR family transcriptional regulator
MAPVVAPRRPANGSQLRADRTRALVIDETVRCILEEGFAAASAKHITERAGVTWGVVQYHFGDRDGLLMAVVDEGFAALTEALHDLPAGAENARDRTEFIVNAAWEAFSSPT